VHVISCFSLVKCSFLADFVFFYYCYQSVVNKVFIVDMGAFHNESKCKKIENKRIGLRLVSYMTNRNSTE